jgi:inorganic triphosphatase YgiF
VRRWHRAWREGGAEALRSRGPVSRERLSAQQWARLELELRRGPLADLAGLRRSLAARGGTVMELGPLAQLAVSRSSG